MNKVTLKQWQMFLAVVKYGSFAQAGERIYRSASSVHHSVNKLEELLNVKLLQVDGRKTHLTPEGKKVYCLIEKLIADANNLESYISRLSPRQESEVKISIHESFPLGSLKFVLQSDCKLDQHEQFESHQVTTTEDDHNAHVVISLFNSPTTGFKVKSVVSVVYAAVTSSKNPAFNDLDFITSDELHKQIEVKLDNEFSGSIENTPVNNNYLKVDKLSSVINLVCEGVGYAWLPLSEIQHLISEGKLRKISLSDQPNLREVDFYLKVREKFNLNPNVANIVQNFKYLQTNTQL
jgi:DNA-binding transcriptional LysR family regulator